MEVKKNLNNVQRKMLDQIYTEQFNFKERAILSQRDTEYNELKELVLVEEARKRNTKTLLEAGKKFFDLLNKYTPDLKEMGLQVDYNYGDRERKVKLTHMSQYGDSVRHPKLQAHLDVTNTIRQELAEKKQLMRSAIYGMATDFDAIKADVEALLAGI